VIGSGLPPRPQLAALMAAVELRELDRD